MSFFQGIRYNLKGLAIGLKTPQLFILGFLRFLIVLVLILILSGLIFYWHEQILSSIWAMPEKGWLFYIWKILSWVLSLILALVATVVSYLLAQIFFGVFIMDYMSRITEKNLTGRVNAPQTSWFELFLYLIKQEIPRVIIPVLVSLTIMILGFFTPISIVTLILSSSIAALFLAWDNTDLVPARRMFPFKERVSFLRKHILFHLGFGLWFLIPWINIVFLSFAPIGATLYHIEREKLR